MNRTKNVCESLTCLGLACCLWAMGSPLAASGLGFLAGCSLCAALTSK